MQKIRKILASDLTSIFLIIIFFSVVYSFVGIQKHYHFQTFAWDTSFFIQALYFINKFQPPVNSLNKINILGDHFNLYPMICLSIFYKIWNNPATLFITQGVMGSFSALPLFLITQKLLSKTSVSKSGIVILSLALSFVYLFSISFQAMMTDEFHNEPFLTLPLLFIFYFLLTKNDLGYWISFILVILTKEIFGLIAIPMGIYIYIFLNQPKKALLTLLVGVLSFYLLISILMPAIAGTSSYLHFAKGNRPSDISAKFINDPKIIVLDFFNQSKKIETIFTGLLSFGFLPLLSPVNLILPISALGIRFYDDTTPRLYEFNNHYAAPFIPLMAISASFGLYRLIIFLTKKCRYKPKKVWFILTLLLISSSLFQGFYYHGAINSMFKKSFYQTLPWEKDAYELIERVPRRITISSQNSLLPHLSERDKFYLLPEIGNAQYIAVDLEEGPNKFSPLKNSQEMTLLINRLIRDNQYRIIWQKHKALLLEKIN